MTIRVAHECMFLGMFDLSKNTMDLLHSRISRSPLSLLIFWIMFTTSNSNMLNLAAPYPCGKGAPRAHQPRIIGGKPAFPGQFPWAVSLRKRVVSTDNFNHHCAGSLITAKHVVTAAHCLHQTKNDDWEVVAGEHRPGAVEKGEQIRKVEVMAPHPEYKYPSFRNDLALLTLSKNVSWTNLVGPICLPSNQDDFTESDGTIVGWGYNAEREDGGKPTDLLMYAKVPILSNENCRKWFANTDKSFLGEMIKDSHLCAGLRQGGRDGCQGDSGGPLTEEDDLLNMLIGIVSVGEGCGRPMKPGIYTRVSEFSSWLESEVG